MPLKSRLPSGGSGRRFSSQPARAVDSRGLASTCSHAPETVVESLLREEPRATSTIQPQKFLPPKALHVPPRFGLPGRIVLPDAFPQVPAYLPRVRQGWSQLLRSGRQLRSQVAGLPTSGESIRLPANSRENPQLRRLRRPPSASAPRRNGISTGRSRTMRFAQTNGSCSARNRPSYRIDGVTEDCIGETTS